MFNRVLFVVHLEGCYLEYLKHTKDYISKQDFLESLAIENIIFPTPYESEFYTRSGFQFAIPAQEFANALNLPFSILLDDGFEISFEPTSQMN